MTTAKKPAKKIQDPQRPKPQPKRTDAAGRSGMGESAKSSKKSGLANNIGRAAKSLIVVNKNRETRTLMTKKKK